MARQCTTPSRSPGQASAAPRVQGNGNPPLQSRAMRGKSEGSANTLTKERFLKNAVGECPEVYIQIGGVPLKCLLDTGSNVSTMTRVFSGTISKEGMKIYTAPRSGLN